MDHVERKVKIVDPKGLHARPAGKIVTLALAHQSELKIAYKGEEADGSSVMDILLLAAPCGAILELRAIGPDAQQLVTKVEEFLRTG